MSYSTNQNPFDDPNENENPFASTATLPKPGPDPLSDREAALNAREAELARREREVAGLTPKNWPPFYPLISHDIAAAIPKENQIVVTRLYQIWMALCATLLFNLLGCIFLLIAGASDGGKDMIGAVVYVPVISVCSFLLWYRPIYWAYAKEHAFFYYVYYLFGGFHLLFSVYMAIGIPSTGSAGLINTIAMFAQTHILAAVFGIISSVGWIFQATAGTWFFRRIWYHGKEAGHTLDKAKGEVAQQGFWFYITNMSKT